MMTLIDHIWENIMLSMETDLKLYGLKDLTDLMRNAHII
jgi:hypothetical protein